MNWDINEHFTDRALDLVDKFQLFMKRSYATSVAGALDPAYGKYRLLADDYLQHENNRPMEPLAKVRWSTGEIIMLYLPNIVCVANLSDFFVGKIHNV